MDFKKGIAVLIAVVTVCATWIAFLQNDASNKDDIAKRDADRLMIIIMGKQVEGEVQVNYEYEVVYQNYTALETQAYASEGRGDSYGASRYFTARDSLKALSPILQDPYFDPETSEIDYSRYVVDVYLREVTQLKEQFTASNAVKEGWGAKKDAYILYLTILTVALFLLGLSATIEITTKWIFAIVGNMLAFVAITATISTYLTPVFDLRELPEAMTSYTEGVMMAYQERYEEALPLLDKAIVLVPDYANALVERANVNAALGNYQEAILDYERAKSLGVTRSNMIGSYAYTHYLLGQFEQGIALNQESLNSGQGELWMQFDVGLMHLANGQIQEAQAEYARGIAIASQLEPSSTLWWSLDNASAELQELAYQATDSESPFRRLIKSPDSIPPIAEALIKQLKSLSVSLELTGKPPVGELTAEISPFLFGEPTYNENAPYLIEDEFSSGVQEMDVLFDYAKMRDGQEVLIKVYIDGIEDPSWRVLFTWDVGESGSTAVPISIAYSDSFVLVTAEYTVELYVDGHLAQVGTFSVVD